MSSLTNYYYQLAGKARTGSELLLAAIKNPPALWHRSRYIFVVSHMRSFSSLLCHILGSHPEISGYAEMSQDYHSRLDLAKLRLKVSASLDNTLTGNFALDKILHDRWFIDDAILRRPDIYLILLIRKPEDTLRSIIGIKPKTTAESASDYYVRRMHTLQAYAERANHRVFLAAEKILDDPLESLELLRSFLGLASHLETDYSQFKLTGQRGYGDPSEFIRAGTIVTERHDYSAIQLPAEALSRARYAYEETLEKLAG